MKSTADQNLVTISHALELGSRIISKVDGEEISTQLDGQNVTDIQTKEALAARMQSGFSFHNGQRSKK